MTGESESRRQYIAPAEVSPERSQIMAAFSELHGEFYRLSEQLRTLPSEQIKERLNLLNTVKGFEGVVDVNETLDRTYSILEDEYAKYCEDPSHDFRGALELAEYVLVALMGEDPKEFGKEFQKKKKQIRTEEEWSKMTEEERQQVYDEGKRAFDKFFEDMNGILAEMNKNTAKIGRNIAKMERVLKKK